MLLPGSARNLQACGEILIPRPGPGETDREVHWGWLRFHRRVWTVRLQRVVSARGRVCADALGASDQLARSVEVLACCPHMQNG